MTLARIVVAAVLVLALAGLAQPAEARSYSSFQLHTPGFSLHIGKYPRYYYQPYYYRHYYYYRPYTYQRRYRRPYRSSRCARWSRRCAANWGYRNSNYYGCLRYHRCR